MELNKHNIQNNLCFKWALYNNLWQFTYVNHFSYWQYVRELSHDMKKEICPVSLRAANGERQWLMLV